MEILAIFDAKSFGAFGVLESAADCRHACDAGEVQEAWETAGKTAWL